MATTDPTLHVDVDRVLDELSPRYQRALSELVQCPSLLGQETHAQHLVATLAADIGLEVDTWNVEPDDLRSDPSYAPVDGGESPRPNVQARLKGRGSGRSLALSGHIDVVPIGPRHLWSRDPFGGEIDGDRLYGRGSLDMKGGMIAALQAIHAVREVLGALDGDVLFESVIEEECSGNGMLAARRRGPDTDAAVIPEISGEQIQFANPGVLWFEVTVTGKAAYVGLAGQSVSAIDLAAEVIEILHQLPDELNARFDHPAYAPFPQPLTLNIGTISGGDWPSNVALECTLGCRLSYPLGWSVEQAQQAVTDHLHRRTTSHPWMGAHPPTLRWHGFRAEGYHIDVDAPIVRSLAEAVESVTAQPARYGPMFGTADARYFDQRGIPAVYYGPDGGGMHAPDEWVSLASVHRVARALARTMMEWCS